MIRPAVLADAPAICAIYNHYIAATTISFEEAPVGADEMAQRMQGVMAMLPWLVYEEENGTVVGYAYATKWRVRAAYRYTVESSVYVAQDRPRRGIGSVLSRALLDELRLRDVHAVIAGIALPNEASVALHERLGYQKVAHFREVGRKFDRWIDVGNWELLL
ncbi:MAG: N-acetyltransferase [Burkholderiaceae bacterium]|nr:N-acetyltransferase [Burkholderiaceae bacterium]